MGAACCRGSSGHHRRQAGLELDGRPIGQRGVQPLAVVDLVDEAADLPAGVAQVAIGAAIDLLVLEGPQKLSALALS